MWPWILLGIGIWIAGMYVYYILDGWFDYGFDDDSMGLAVISALTWPIWIWFVIPAYYAGKAHDALKERKKLHTEKKEKEKKIRIQAEEELAKIEEELELHEEQRHSVT